MKLRSLFLIIFPLLGCQSPDLQIDVPHCIKAKIKKITKEHVYNPPAEVWQIKTDGKTFYYFTSDCCDQFNYLYTEDCKKLCAPDGGFTGGGDGNCPDFSGNEQRTLVWKDRRN